MPPYSRSRRWGVALAAGGAAAAAGLAAYWYWYSENSVEPKEDEDEDEDDDNVETNGLDRMSNGKGQENNRGEENGRAHAHAHGNHDGHANGHDDRGRDRPRSPSQHQLDINAHVDAHFRSIQSIARETTVGTLLEPLANNVKSMDDMDDIIARLQREKRSLSTAEKLSLWESVLDRVTCRFVCVVWLVPMLQLLVRVQLNVMGRTLYLQMSLRNERGRGRGGSLPRGPRASPLSGRAQEAYLRLSEHVVYQGCYVMRDMAKEISSATAAAFVEELGSVGATTRAASVAEAVGRALAAFERERLEGDGWREWERTIIPDDDEVSALFDGAELGPGERFEVEGMWRETVGVYRSEAFRTRYLAGCARAMASGMLRELAEGGSDRGDGGGDGSRDGAMPLVQILPRVARAVDEAMRTAEFGYGLMDTRLEALSASVYANGCV